MRGGLSAAVALHLGFTRMEALIIFLLVAGALCQFVGIVEVAGRASEVPWLEPALDHVRRWLTWWADRIRRGGARLRRFLRSLARREAAPPETVARARTAESVARATSDVSVSGDSARIQNLEAEIQDLRVEVGNLNVEARGLRERVGAAEAQIAEIRQTLPKTVKKYAPRPSWLGIGLLFLGLFLITLAGVLALVCP